jgi:hypothetical protein
LMQGFWLHLPKRRSVFLREWLKHRYLRNRWIKF